MKKKILGALLFGIYLLGLRDIALRSEGSSPWGERYGNIVPFRSLFDELTHSVHSWPHKAYYLLGNLCLMVPFVISLLLLHSTISLVLLAGMAFFLSSVIEMVQYCWVPGRAGDIDDVILNTAGAVAVCLLVGRFRARQSPTRAAERQ